MPHSSSPAPDETQASGQSPPKPGAVPMRWVIASANRGKLREFRELFAGLPYDLTSLGELNLPSPEETGGSFLANATLKARHAVDLSGLAAVADDSGLEVDALGGAPGIFSARYAGAEADDAANNAKLMRELSGVPLQRRRARYRCVLVFLDTVPAAVPLVATGVWEGVILDAPRGGRGFGYDPYFWVPELNRTAAELEPAEKNRLSHRGAAVRALRAALRHADSHAEGARTDGHADAHAQGASTDGHADQRAVVGRPDTRA